MQAEKATSCALAEISKKLVCYIFLTIRKRFDYLYS